jgi:hypothetical protein
MEDVNVSRDMQEFEAKILDAAAKATSAEQAAAKAIVDKADIRAMGGYRTVRTP